MYRGVGRCSNETVVVVAVVDCYYDGDDDDQRNDDVGGHENGEDARNEVSRVSGVYARELEGDDKV
jgi:hypothetical protein